MLSRPKRGRVFLATLMAATFTLGGAAMAGAAHAPNRVKPSAFLVSVPHRHTVRLLIEAALGTANGGLNFDGYAKGQMTILIPRGWRVDVTFENNASDLGHSAVVTSWSWPLTGSGPKPVFAGAASPGAGLGTPKGKIVHFQFVADRNGRYRLVCAVPGHADLGMWDVVVVNQHLKAPRLILH